MKNYVGISRDHSGSMRLLTSAAMRDYNNTVASIRSNAEGMDTVVSVVSCGINNGVRREVTNSSVTALQPLTSYIADGQTPLFDSVGELIEGFLASPDAHDQTVSFLVLAITDGAENASQRWRTALAAKVRELQMTDRWTFAFRVPRGYKSVLVGLGIPEGNILEWEQSEHGFAVATAATEQAMGSYFTARRAGVRSTRGFYSDIGSVGVAVVEQQLANISSQVAVFAVTEPSDIRDFINSKGLYYALGCAFYQLTKHEKAVQDHKQMVIRDRQTSACYSGDNARRLLGLPHGGTISVDPGNHGRWDIFIQSTSVNRKLVPGTSVLYWRAAGR